MKIAFDLRCLSIPEKANRGTGQDISELLKAFHRIAPETVRFLVLLARGQRFQPPGPRFDSVLLDWDYGDISRSHWWRESRRCGAFLESLGVGVYHAPDLYVPRGFRRPIVVMVHDCYRLPLLGPVTLFGARYGWRWNASFRWRYALTWHALHGAAAIATNSRFTAAQVADLHPSLAPLLRPVPWGIDPAWQDAPRGPGRARTRFGLEGPILLHVGGLERRKNPGGILEAFARVRAEVPETILVLAGPPCDRPEGPGIRTLGLVTQEELRDLYDDADLLLFPSFAEGFGRPVLEALARGCPVVTSRGTATEEVAGPWVPSGHARLVDPGSPEEIAAAARAFLAAPRPAPARPLRTYDDAAADLLAIYRDIAVARGPAE